MPRERMYRPRPGTKVQVRFPNLACVGGWEVYTATVLRQGRKRDGIYTRLDFDEPTRIDGGPCEFVHEIHPCYVHPLPTMLTPARALSPVGAEGRKHGYAPPSYPKDGPCTICGWDRLDSIHD